MKPLLALFAAVLVVACILWGRAETPVARERRSARPSSDGIVSQVIDAIAGRSAATESASGSQGDEGASRKYVLEGQVLDDNEQSVSDAIVTLDNGATTMSRTGADGIFSFRAVPGAYSLAASKGPLATGPLQLQLAETTGPVTLHLRPGAQIRVLVVDASTRTPLVGASIEVASSPGARAVTAGDGVANLQGLSFGEQRLSISLPHYVPKEVGIEAVRDGSSAPESVALKSGAPLRGVVYDGQSHPVAGAKVRVEDVDGLALTGLRQMAVTDAEGRYVFEAVAGGRIRVVAEHDAFGLGHSGTVRLDGATEESLDVRLNRGAALVGKVVDVSGRPVAGATVTIVPSGAGEGVAATRQTTSNVNGVFEVNGLPHAGVRVTASLNLSQSPPSRVDLSRGRESIVLSLPESVSIGGTVRTPSGEPAPDVQVTAVPVPAQDAPQSGGPTPHLATAVTDVAGRFQLSGLAKTSYRVGVSRDASAKSTAESLSNGTIAYAGARNVDLVLQERGTIRGRVLLDTGEAPRRTFRVDDSLALSGVVSGEDGSFELHDLEPGKHSLTLSGAEFSPQFVDDIVVTSGADVDVGTVRARSLRSVEGTVTTASGEPVQGAAVAVRPYVVTRNGGGSPASDGAGSLAATTDAAGHFVIEGLPRLPLFASAESAAFGSSPATPVPSDDKPSISLIVQPTGSVEGTVTTKDGPVSGALVVATTPEVNRARTVVTTDSFGKYRFDALASGGYVVTVVSAPDLGATAQSALRATVMSSATTRLDFTLSSDTIDLLLKLVSSSTGRPPLGAMVYLATGALSESTAGELEDALVSRGDGLTFTAVESGGRPVQFYNVPQGSYSMCIVVINADVTDARVAARIQREAAQQPVVCLPFTLSANHGMDEATATVAVP